MSSTIGQADEGQPCFVRLIPRHFTNDSQSQRVCEIPGWETKSGKTPGFWSMDTGIPTESTPEVHQIEDALVIIVRK